VRLGLNFILIKNILEFMIGENILIENIDITGLFKLRRQYAALFRPLPPSPASLVQHLSLLIANC
jgi:hypothetical protein